MTFPKRLFELLTLVVELLEATLARPSHWGRCRRILGQVSDRPEHQPDENAHSPNPLSHEGGPQCFAALLLTARDLAA